MKKYTIYFVNENKRIEEERDCATLMGAKSAIKREIIDKYPNAAIYSNKKDEYVAFYGEFKGYLF